MNPLATEEEIKYISEDLLGEPLEKIHNCLNRKKWSIETLFPQWVDHWPIRKDICQLMQDNFDLPAYFLDKVLLTIQKGIETGDYLRDQWYQASQLLMLQNKVSSKSLLNHILFLAKMVKPDRFYSGSLDFTRVELISAVVSHKNLSPDDLTLLCAHPDSLIRDLASKNPLCSNEGKIVLALMGGVVN